MSYTNELRIFSLPVRVRDEPTGVTDHKFPNRRPSPTEMNRQTIPEEVALRFCVCVCVHLPAVLPNMVIGVVIFRHQRHGVYSGTGRKKKENGKQQTQTQHIINMGML